MKKVFLFAAVALVALASCTSEEMIEVTNPQDNSPSSVSNAIEFASATQGVTRAGELVGATAAEKLGKMFVVEGTKGKEETNSPSLDVVFDNYLVGYNYNSAGTAKSNTNNWEYVGLQDGIDGKLSSTTWSALHPSDKTKVKEQSIKYWDYSTTQYDFIAWSTGERKAVTTGAVAGSAINVTRINTGTTLATDGFTMTAANATDLLQCYYTDINTVAKANYGKPVTLTFKNMAAKVRVAFYETVPGYSVKDVQFYTADDTEHPTAPTDLGTKPIAATLFTTGSYQLPQSGAVTVMYPHIGTGNSSKETHNKAKVSVAPGSTKSSTQAFGELTNQYRDETGNEPDGKYLGTSLPDATYAGSAADNYYTAVIPNNNGYPLTLRVNYTLVSTDGSDEVITVYGAKAVVPATYTAWQPNYAYTYIFKISDNSNGWTTTGATTNNQGLYPITFDAVVTSFTDVNAEQTTVTTVATPSITTYQQGHTKANNEYSKSQIAGVSTDVKDVYVQVMDNSGAIPSLKGDLNGEKKSLLYKITKSGTNYEASEAEVMDALQNRTNKYSDESPVGRNGVTLTKNSHISNTETQIVNGVDDQPITVASGSAAKIDIDNSGVTTGAYAYVYAITVPTSDEVIYNVASVSTDDEAKKYYEVNPSSLTATSDATAQANKVYFVANRNAKNDIVSYTFKQTKVGESVTGLFEATINIASATKATSYTVGNFYFDVYNQNKGEYAVKVIKIID